MLAMLDLAYPKLIRQVKKTKLKKRIKMELSYK